jgi:hypothetical protein
MHWDVSTIIWIVVVLFGVISSLVSNARKAMQQSQITPQQSRVPVHEQSFMPAPEMPQPMAIPIPVDARAPVVITKRKPAPKVAEKQPVDTAEHAFASLGQRRDGTKRFRGMFDRENLASAFVASQVFGPPKALQEQSIWSPRHSEPSI